MEIQRSRSLNTTLVGFTQEPDGRGTLSLLFSCVFTLSLCVWSAVHLNLPGYDERQVQYTYRYLKWSILGVFGPELVIWAAWRQYISARALTKVVREVNRFCKDPTPGLQWTMVHSFYAGMGGFIFDLDSPDIANGQPFIPHQRRLHVTPRGMQLLAKCGLLPCIAREDITDKSKTDGSGKVICCIQVAWMVVQAIARVAVGLPVTPLETNTIAHVVCAFINYALWWNKPRWIKEPTILRGEWTRSMCAYMYMSSQVSAADRIDRDILRDFGVKTEMSYVLYVPGTADTHAKGFAQATNEQVANTSEKPGQDDSSGPSPPPSDTKSEKSQPRGGHMVPRGDVQSGIASPCYPQCADEAPEVALANAMRQTRWKLASEAIDGYSAIRERLEPRECNEDDLRYREALRLYPEMPQSVREQFKRHRDPGMLPELRGGPEGLVCTSEELVVDRPRNWPGDDLIRHMQGHLMGIILWTASTVYGAIHVAGWNEQFPTTMESWFWRASALYIVFSGLLWSLLNLLGHLSGSVWWYWYNILAGGVRRKSHVVIYVLCCIGGTLYFVARSYLVVEAFVSLRALPASAYDSPSWILTVPHL